jgi:hypothetical protein
MDGQTTQWPEEKGQKHKQRSVKHRKIQHRAQRTTLKTEGELGCSGRVSSYCFISGIRCDTLVTNPVLMHELGKN